MPDAKMSDAGRDNFTDCSNNSMKMEPGTTGYVLAPLDSKKNYGSSRCLENNDTLPLPRLPQVDSKVTPCQLPSISSLGACSVDSILPKAAHEPSRTEENVTTTASRRRRKPLRNTKRAEQNRNAQKAFRLRKEQYVKDLEHKVQSLQGLATENAILRYQNLQLRHIVETLQKQQAKESI